MAGIGATASFDMVRMVSAGSQCQGAQEETMPETLSVRPVICGSYDQLVILAGMTSVAL